MKKLLDVRFLTILNSVAMVLVSQSANAACSWMFHQPEFPQEANCLRKTK